MNTRNTTEVPRQVGIRDTLTVTAARRLTERVETRPVFDPATALNIDDWKKMQAGMLESVARRNGGDRNPDGSPRRGETATAASNALSLNVLPLLVATFLPPEVAKEILTDDIGQDLRKILDEGWSFPQDWAIAQRIILGANLKIAFPHLFPTERFSENFFVAFRESIIDYAVQEEENLLAILALAVVYPSKSPQELGMGRNTWKTFLELQRDRLNYEEDTVGIHIITGFMLSKIFSQDEEQADIFMKNYYQNNLETRIENIIAVDNHADFWILLSNFVFLAAILSSKKSSINEKGQLVVDFGKEKEKAKNPLPGVLEV